MIQSTHFQIQNFGVESQLLKDNPLGDSYRRNSLVLVPKGSKQIRNAVFVLAGFTGNGPHMLNLRFHEPNFLDHLENETNQGTEFKETCFVLVDALTFWGGSQFLDSEGCGMYASYIAKELFPRLQNEFAMGNKFLNVAVFGASSGGYGALHLATLYPDIFPTAYAVAPDCAFEISLLPDLQKATQSIQGLGGIAKIRELLASGELMNIRRDWHTLVNAIGMAFCYGSIDQTNTAKTGQWSPEWPLDFHTLELNKLVWENHWLAKDPIVFLPKRRDALLQLKGLCIDVGKNDQFNLQYGARRLGNVLKSLQVPFEYNEFKGDHFTLSSRRPHFLKWLKERGFK